MGSAAPDRNGAVPIDLTSDIGLEKISRAALLLLYENLNESLDSQNTQWSTGGELADDEFWQAIGQPDRLISLESIQDKNFYVGHVPSLVNSTPDRYPNVCVHCATAVAVPGDQYDSTEELIVQMWVEVMCKSLLSEEDLNARTLRTVEAVHASFLNNDPRHSVSARTLRSLVSPLHNTPSVTVGDVFTKRESSGHGDKWYWQGARITYAVSKTVTY